MGSEQRAEESRGLFAVRRKVVTLTDAQIKALPTTPVQIVPAPGVDQFLILLNAVLRANTAGGAYTNVSSDNFSYLRFWYGANDFASLKTDRSFGGFDLASTLIDGRITLFPQMQLLSIASPLTFVGPDIYATSDVAGQPLVLVGANTAGNFTGGNAANTMHVAVHYLVESLS